MEGLISYNEHINLGTCCKHIKLQNSIPEFLSDKYSVSFFSYSNPIGKKIAEYLSDENSVIEFCNLMCFQKFHIFILPF